MVVALQPRVPVCMHACMHVPLMISRKKGCLGHVKFDNALNLLNLRTKANYESQSRDFFPAITHTHKEKLAN